jgi:hypothetical protein
MPLTHAKKLAATAVEQYNLYHEYSESDPELSAGLAHGRGQREQSI